MFQLTKAKKIIGISVLVLALSGTGAGYYLSAQAQAEAPQEQMQPPPAMPVQVELIKLENTKIWKDFSSRLDAVDYAEIRPQVSGTITEIKFEDGQNVQEGDVLYVIDPRPYQAAVDQAEAELAVAKNVASLAQKELNRAKGLIKTDAISQRILDERRNDANVAWSSVKSAEALLDLAKINLDYAYVKAPISGRISRAEITEGNLVEAGPNAPVLTSIVSDQGIYADFEVDEQTYLNYVRNSAKDRDAENRIPVELSLKSDDKTYQGFVHSFDNRIDVSSGTIRARALFANEDGALLPGMFANIRMGSPNTEAMILVSERAIGTDQDRKFVYVVNDQNMVDYREVKIGESIRGKRVIKTGLNEGDKVISDGIIRIRPGMPVSPQVSGAPPSEIAQITE